MECAARRGGLRRAPARGGVSPPTYSTQVTVSLLIDGYNLMHAAGIVGRGVGPGGLERSRHALLNSLAESIELSERRRTTVVFDAAGAPPGLPSEFRHEEIHVRFARGYADADELIEALILADSAPRRLLVVSSDHRLHRAARRRRAKAIDSDRWYAEILRRRMERHGQPAATPSAKPQHAPGPDEVNYWLERFGQSPADPSPPMADDLFPPGYVDDVADDKRG